MIGIAMEILFFRSNKPPSHCTLWTTKTTYLKKKKKAKEVNELNLAIGNNKHFLRIMKQGIRVGWQNCFCFTMGSNTIIR